jgi:hypothetical protein
LTSLIEAAAPLFAVAFSLFGAEATWLELVAVVLAIAMVVLNIRVNPLAWPLAIVSSLLYFLLFWKSRLYGEASLQILFVAVAGWGWWQWLRGTDAAGKRLAVRALDVRGRWIAVAVMGLAWPAIALFLARATDTDVPWWDAFPTGRKHRRPVAAGPQVRRELADLDRREPCGGHALRLQGTVAHDRALRRLRRHVCGRLAGLATAGRAPAGRHVT